jgi:acetolactate synthase-1/2/3 large subunit
MLRQAFSTMLNGRPGPVHLDVPLNVFVEETGEDVPDPASWRHGVSRRSAAHPEDIERALDMLLGAQRPVIVAGHGVELGDASEELVQFAAATGIPVAHTPLGKGVFDARSPLSLGATGRNGTYAANRATREADVILALGTRFDDRSTSAWLPGYTYAIPPTRLIHVDIDPGELGRNYPAALAIIANAKDVLDQLHRACVQLEPSGFAQWRAQTDAWKAEWERHIAPQRGSDVLPIRPERLLADVRRVFPQDGILLSDVGVHHNWIVQEWPAYAPRTVLQSWGFAAMGFGVAGVLGARLAAPERPMLSIVGDGGFILMPSAVATAVEYELPAVWIVWNNYGYVSIRDLQRGYFGGRELATSFERAGERYTPDYAAIARSMGADGAIVEAPSELAEQLEAALASGRPTVLDVRVDSEASLPAAASWDLPPLPHPQPNFGWE